MKKLLTLFLLLAVSTSFAQSFECEEGTDVVVWKESTETDIAIYLHINNTSQLNRNVHVTRNVTQDLAGSANYFCFGTNCYDPNTSQSSQSVAIAPGGSDDSFVFHLAPAGNNGTFVAEYTFYNESNQNDALVVTITVNTTPTGQHEVNVTHNTINLIAPNPAAEFTTVDYSTNEGFENASIEVYNMLGAKVKTVEVFETNGSQIVETSDLQSGVYMMNLMVDGRIVSTKRLIVNR